MEPRESDRPRTLSWSRVVLPLGLGFVVSLGLAYQAWDASREHRKRAEAAVSDHAAFAAHLLGSRIDRRMSQALLYAFYRVDLAIRVQGTRWPDAEALRVAQEIERCGAVVPAEQRVFFRWVEGQGLDVSGPAPTGFADWLATWVPETARRQPEARSSGIRFGAPGIGPRGVAFRVYRLPEGTALFGLDNCFRDLEEDVFAAAMTGASVLPPSLVGDTPNDSLIDLLVLNGEGRPLRGEPGEGHEGYGGRAEVEPAAVYDGLEVVVGLTAGAASRLLLGGLPRSRLPEALALVGLTGLLLALAAVQLHRGQELVRLRERFVANVSHELRTPLQQIVLYSDLLTLEKLHDESERRHALAVIHREARRLIELVENVLAFSRSREGEPAPLRPRPTPLLELARGAVAAFRPIGERRGVGLDLAGEEVAASVDPDALHRALLNLLDNAVKYGPEGQTVRITLEKRGSNAVVSVADEGPGIPAEDRERVWQPHIRLERDGEGGRSGQGLGLAIVRELVERMGGRVSLDAAPGGGARFSIHIPLSES